GLARRVVSRRRRLEPACHALTEPAHPCIVAGRTRTGATGGPPAVARVATPGARGREAGAVGDASLIRLASAVRHATELAVGRAATVHPAARPAALLAALRRARRGALDAVHVRAGPAQPLVLVHEQVGLLEVHDRSPVPRLRVVHGGILGAGRTHAGLAGLTVVVAPAGAGGGRAMDAAQDVDLELRAALVHVPEELEHGRVVGLAVEQPGRHPDA